jgi:N-acetylmuramate 1-kinase
MIQSDLFREVGAANETSRRSMMRSRPQKQPMSAAKPVSSNPFELSAADRLAEYLRETHDINGALIALTPDASTRNYFRIPWKKGSAVAAVYAEPFDPEIHPYLDVTRLFLSAGIPVPETLAVDGTFGIIVQEDLGDRQLFHVYDSGTEEECEEFKERAISLIAQIQKATEAAYETKSISSRLAFDEAKLSWELDFFTEHYFKSLRQETLRHGEAAELKAEMNDLAAELAAAPRVLCHHQDARMGPATYDLVSFLLDRQPATPSLAELRHHRLYFLEERRLLGLSALDPDEFAREFRLMTVQRGLKAVGTFSCQTAVYGRGAVYEPFIKPTFEIVLQAAEWLERFPVLCRMITARIKN